MENETSSYSILKLFPNPAFDFVTLAYKTSDKEYNRLKVDVKDVHGRVVLSQYLEGGNNEELLDLSNLSSGSYNFLLYADKNIIAVEKLQVIK